MRFVNTDPDLEPAELVAIGVDVDPALAIETVAVDDLPSDWRTYPAPPTLAEIGGRWVRESRSVLSVPSAVISIERNLIINPAHADFTRLTIHPAEPFSFDPRMWK